MNKIRLLLVDDEESFCQIMKMSLELEDDFEVCVVTEGESALEEVRAFKPDLVLLDIVMPDISGSDVFIQLRSDEDCKEIPVAFFTALDKKEMPDEIRNSEGYSYIQKPISREELIDRVRNLLGRCTHEEDTRRG